MLRSYGNFCSNRTILVFFCYNTNIELEIRILGIIQPSGMPFVINLIIC